MTTIELYRIIKKHNTCKGVTCTRDCPARTKVSNRDKCSGWSKQSAGMISQDESVRRILKYLKKQILKENITKLANTTDSVSKRIHTTSSVVKHNF